MKVLKFIKNVGKDLLKGLMNVLLVFVGMLIFGTIMLFLMVVVGAIALCIAYGMSYLLFNNDELTVLIIWIIEIFSVAILIDIVGSDNSDRRNTKKVNYFKKKWKES